MNRRRFLTVATGLLAPPLFGVRAQQPARIFRVGVLTTTPPVPALRDALLQGLRELGYVEGRNLTLIWLDAGGDLARLPAKARELVGLGVDVFVSAGPSVGAAKEATQTIPIVMAVSSDAVAHGLVASLARPGGNVTGLTLLTPELTAKRIDLLKAMLPQLARIGLLVDRNGVAGATNTVRQAEQAGQTLGISVSVAGVRAADDLAPAVAKLADARAQALVIQLTPLTFLNRARIAELANSRHLPAIAEVSEFATAGLLCSYGTELAESYRLAATYVDKILKGAKPADLPVEQPTTFEFVINMKTARALGLNIPHSVMLRADRLID